MNNLNNLQEKQEYNQRLSQPGDILRILTGDGEQWVTLLNSDRTSSGYLNVKTQDGDNITIAETQIVEYYPQPQSSEGFEVLIDGDETEDSDPEGYMTYQEAQASLVSNFPGTARFIMDVDPNSIVDTSILNINRSINDDDYDVGPDLSRVRSALYRYPSNVPELIEANQRLHEFFPHRIPVPSRTLTRRINEQSGRIRRRRRRDISNAARVYEEEASCSVM